MRDRELLSADDSREDREMKLTTLILKNGSWLCNLHGSRKDLEVGCPPNFINIGEGRETRMISYDMVAEIQEDDYPNPADYRPAPMIPARTVKP